MSEAEQLEIMRREFGRLQTAYAAAELRLSLVRQLFGILNTTFDETEILQQVLESLGEAVGVEAGSILLLDPSDDKLFFAAATGPKADEIKEFRLDPGIGVSGWSFSQNEPVAVSDVASDPRFYKQISKSLGFETRSLVCAPIRIGGQAAGVVELVNKQAGDEFHTDDVELVKMAGVLCGSLLENARLHNELSAKST